MSVSRDVRHRAEDMAYQLIMAALALLAVVLIVGVAVLALRLALGM